jgi:choline dehydrogenase-like flavoprotein
MEYTRLGSSGLKVSRISLGCMSYGDGSPETWALDYDDAAPFFRQALDLPRASGDRGGDVVVLQHPGHGQLGNRESLGFSQRRKPLDSA